MTTVIYYPNRPAMEFRGHARAGDYGRDVVCAALSILLYTLIETAPQADVAMSEGYARVEGSEKIKVKNGGRLCPLEGDKSESVGEAGTAALHAFAFAAAGVRLLAEQYPQFVRLEVKT